MTTANKITVSQAAMMIEDNLRHGGATGTFTYSNGCAGFGMVGFDRFHADFKGNFDRVQRLVTNNRLVELRTGGLEYIVS